MAKAPKKGKAWGFHRRWPYLAIRVGPPQPSLVVSPETGNLAVGNQLIGGLNIRNGKPFYPHVREPIVGGIQLTGTTSVINPDSALPEYTATHYVAPHSEITGVSADTDVQTATDYSNATSSSDPCTIACALANAVAGDVVQVGDGSYEGTSTNDKNTPAFRPTNSGTASNRIIFFAENRAGLTYQAGVTTRLSHSGGTGPVFGGNTLIPSGSSDYVTWDGFFLDETMYSYAKDTGSIVFWGGDGNHLLSCVLLGIDAGNQGDNHCGVRIEGCNDFVMSDCYISGIGVTGTSAHNAAAIMTYSSDNTTIDHNTFIGNNSAIYLKGSTGPFAESQNGFEVHHNWIDGTGAPQGGQGINLTEVPGDSPVTDLCRIYQNVIIDCTSEGGIVYIEPGSGPYCDGIRIVNNTIWNCFRGITTRNPGFSFADHILQNNIVSACTRAFDDFDAGSTLAGHLTLNADYNVYHSYSDFMNDDGGPLNSLTLATVQSNGQETNTLESDPQFENTGSDDFRLASGSPYRTDDSDPGVDVLNLLGGGTSAPINRGAYILADQSDQIGRRT